MTAKKTISAEEFDRLFDEGEDVLDYVDLDNVVTCAPGTMQWPGKGGATRRVGVDFTERTIRELDEEAEIYGIPRQAVIKTIVVDELERRRLRRLAAARASA